jgi:uncharacterized protein YaaW (UPF0174 family)
MSYRLDEDLEFLQYCSDESLEDLVSILIKDTDGSERYTESLTDSDKYKEHYPKHSMYYEEISKELQTYGGHTIVNIFRGNGVLYKEILMDVCDKIKVNYNNKSDTHVIEENLLMKIFKDSLSNMSETNLKKLAEEMDLKTTSFTKEAIFASFQTIFKLGGFKSYQYTVQIANLILKALIGRGLSFAGNTVLTRAASVLTGPIGMTITALWTVSDIAGPAYRVTSPAVIVISALRMQLKYKDEKNG